MGMSCHLKIRQTSFDQYIISEVFSIRSHTLPLINSLVSISLIEPISTTRFERCSCSVDDLIPANYARSIFCKTHLYGSTEISTAEEASR